MTEYGRIHTDGSRSGRQATQSNIFDACDVQKHTLIVDQDYASHTIKVKSLKDSQPTQSDALTIAASALLADVRRRHPNEDLRCEYMIALDAALQEQIK